MWLINSSIGRKVVMSVTGIALVLFLTFHASMNVVALISTKGYNMICEFLGANWYAVAATVGLAALVALHFIYAIWLTLQNRKARGSNSYAITSKPEKVEWASQNMLVLGIIVVLGMVLHLYNFWYNMMFAELAHTGSPELAADGVHWIGETFKCPVYTGIYLVWLAALWFHLTHGVWSAIQTLGWNGKTWFCRWKIIGYIWSTLVVLMFAAVALFFALGGTPILDGKCGGEGGEMRGCACEMRTPCDKDGRPEMKGGCPGQRCGGCPEKEGRPCEQGCPEEMGRPEKCAGCNSEGHCTCTPEISNLDCSCAPAKPCGGEEKCGTCPNGKK